ncbi:hypothetical protein TNCV_3578931 [Trichonephila clavipes]|nr:hypothetical protein TNCV_3578931 [Trichonephila clavipes]
MPITRTWLAEVILGMTSYRQIFMQYGHNGGYKNFHFIRVKDSAKKIFDSSGDSSETKSYLFRCQSKSVWSSQPSWRVKHKDGVSVDLVTSKSRVAPSEKDYPRQIELMGALLAARLAKEVKKI